MSNAAVTFDLTTIAGLNSMLDATQADRDAAATMARFSEWHPRDKGFARTLKPRIRGMRGTIPVMIDPAGATWFWTVCRPSGRASRGHAATIELAQAAADAVLVVAYVNGARPKM